MIKELREVGRVNDAPILIILLELAKKDWVGLAHKNNLEFLSICFWSTRDEQRMSTNELLGEVEAEVVARRNASAANQESEVLWEIQYKQPLGWDRWLGGIPRPVRAYFDDVLHARLRALLKTLR